MPKTKRYFSPEYSFFPVLFGFAALQITQSYIFWYEYAKFNKMHQREHKSVNRNFAPCGSIFID